jgi:heptosyltransferase-2
VIRTLVVQTAWLGDVVLTTPLLQALAERDGPVDVLVTPDAAPLLRTHPAVRDVLIYDKRGADRGLRGLWRQARGLRARGYARAVLAQGSFRSGLLVRAAGIPHRIGFADEAAARWCTDRRARTDGHQADRLRALAEPGPVPGSPRETGGPRRARDRWRPRARFGGIHHTPTGRTPIGHTPTERAPGSTALSLALTDADHAAATDALGAAGVQQPFVALAPGSARPTKRWPFYGELAAALAPEIGVVVIGTRQDAKAAQGRAGGSTDGFGSGNTPAGPPARRPADLCGLPIRVSAAILARAAVAVVNDSAPLHLAQAVGTPVVALFGPTHPELGFGPRGPHDLVLGIDLACRPCSTHGGTRCPLHHHHCLRELAVTTVRDAVHRTLAHREVTCV